MRKECKEKVYLVQEIQLITYIHYVIRMYV